MSKLRIPKIIGHRGAKAYAPENTLVAIHTAADMGVEWVEIDVKLTKDFVPIIFHDEDLLRCAGTSGLVKDMDLKEIQELDVGSFFSESFIGEKIPTLEEALNIILNRGMGVNLEIKPCPGREVETTEAALDIATRIWPDDTPPPLISSFQHVSLETSQDMIPQWPRGLLLHAEPTENWLEVLKYLQASTLHIDGNEASQEQIESFLDAEVPVLAYNVNEPMRACELLDLGITGVFTDDPDSLFEVLETVH